MLRNFKKLISLVLVLALSAVISLPAFADVDHNSVKDSGVKDSAITYISQADAELLANQCIKEQVVIGNHCCWTTSTKIAETAGLFDFEDHTNAYLFRLTTNGKRTGYVFVNAYAKAPCVEAFGYDCNSMLDSMLSENHKSKVTTSDHIIYAHGLVFLTKDKGGNYFVIDDKTKKLDESKSDLIAEYKNTMQETADVDSQTNLKGLKVNTVKLTQTIYSQYDVSGIWSSGYQIFLTSDFPGYTNHCAPTAGTNLIYYWSHYGTPTHSELWQGSVFKDLYKYMNTNVGGVVGTYPDYITDGLCTYAISRNAPIVDSNSSSGDWDFFVDYLNSDRPIIFCVFNDTHYTNHAMLAVGYQDTSTGKYIRVADGGARTFSNFYKYPGKVGDARYVSW